MMMMVQVMPEALRRRVMERFPTSGIGLQIAEQIEEADLSARQQLVAERERLTAAFEHSLPPLDAAISKAQKAAEKTRQAYLAADLVLRKADSARHAVVMTYDRERGDINHRLRGSANQAIDAFQVELRERDEAQRRDFSVRHYDHLDRAAAKSNFSQTTQASNECSRRSGTRARAQTRSVRRRARTCQPRSPGCATPSRRWVPPSLSARRRSSCGNARNAPAVDLARHHRDRRVARRARHPEPHGTRRVRHGSTAGRFRSCCETRPRNSATRIYSG